MNHETFQTLAIIALGCASIVNSAGIVLLVKAQRSRSNV